MKKLLLCAIGVLSLLNATPAQAIIWARQVWEHKDDPSKKVEILFDTHAQYQLGYEKGIDQKDFVISNNIEHLAQQQKKDIAWNALLHGDKVHVWVEDQYSFLLEKRVAQKDFCRNWVPVCALSGLSKLFRQVGISHANLDFRLTGSDYSEIENEVAKYNDTIARSYQANRADYLFDARLVHKVAHCSAQHQIVVVGANHGLILTWSLPQMGYRLKENGLSVHPELQKIMVGPATSWLEVSIQNESALFLKAKSPQDYDRMSWSVKEEDHWWTSAFCITHPINIRAIVEQERKEAAAKATASVRFAGSSPTPVLAMAHAGISLSARPGTPTLRSRL